MSAPTEITSIKFSIPLNMGKPTKKQIKAEADRRKQEAEKSAARNEYLSETDRGDFDERF